MKIVKMMRVSTMWEQKETIPCPVHKLEPRDFDKPHCRTCNGMDATDFYTARSWPKEKDETVFVNPAMVVWIEPEELRGGPLDDIPMAFRIYTLRAGDSLLCRGSAEDARAQWEACAAGIDWIPERPGLEGANVLKEE